MPKVVAISFSDLHINNWKQFNVNNARLTKDIDVLRNISRICKKHNCPALFSGDLIHNPEYMHNTVFVKLLKGYKMYFEDEGIDFYAISGNHDQCEKNTIKNISPNYLQGLNAVFKTFHLIDFKVKQTKDFKVMGIPYLSGNLGFKKCVTKLKKALDPFTTNILLVHTDFPGALDTDGREVNSNHNLPEKFKKLFNGFDLVLSGHIHRPQVIQKGKILMIGSPKQQRRDDEGCEQGYWEIYEDNTYKFVEFTTYPKFIKLKPGKEEPDTFNYYTKQPVIQKEEQETKSFTSTNSKSKLAKRYCKKKNIKDPGKIDTLINILRKTDE